jgi:D-amino acid aminotransferase
MELTFRMKTVKVYINGRFVPEDKACVSVFDRGLNYGDGIFETMKALDGRLIFLKDHLARLRSGLRAIGFPHNAINAIVKDLSDIALERLLKINGLYMGYAYLKIIVTRGPDRDGHFPLKKPSPTVIVVCKALDAGAISKYNKQGVKITLVEGLRPALPAIKSLNFLPNVLGKLYASKRGSFEAIFAEKGSLIEGTSTNLFVVKGSVLLTPAAGKAPFGILPGIMRKNVIRCARLNNVSIKETNVRVRDIMSSKEAFLTNSILDIVPITHIDSKPIGNGKPGAVTRLVQEIICHEMISLK